MLIILDHVQIQNAVPRNKCQFRVNWNFSATILVNFMVWVSCNDAILMVWVSSNRSIWLEYTTHSISKHVCFHVQQFIEAHAWLHLTSAWLSMTLQAVAMRLHHRRSTRESMSLWRTNLAFVVTTFCWTSWTSERLSLSYCSGVCQMLQWIWPTLQMAFLPIMR